MENLSQAIKYFQDNKGYERLFKGIKNKYMSLGEIRGNVIITKPTIQEKQALSGLMKKDYSKNSTITINLKKLQQILDNSRFYGIELLEILNGYFKEGISTKKQNIEKYKSDLEEFFEYILEKNYNTYIYKYIQKSIKNKDELYYNLKKHYNKEKELLQIDLLKACTGINNLPKEMKRIPVFASEVTLNPHGFDKKTLCGKLFILLLCYINNLPYPKNSEELSELYYKNNLLVDDVSSMVLCKNISAFIKTDEYIEHEEKCIKYEEHEGWKGFYKYNEPIFFTLYNLSNIAFIDECSKYKKVVITENPAVFMEIMTKCRINDFPLVCTYGQVRLAGIVLLDLLTKAGYKLYYSGDLDPEGLQIADKLKQRYKGNLELFGFDKETFCRNVSNVELSNIRLQKLNSIKTYELQELGKVIKNSRCVAYEEKNIDYIIKFIENIKQ